MANLSKAPKKQAEDPIHFVGIGGSGMSALAELALSRGLKVQGSDAKRSPALDRLAALGAKVVARHNADLVTGARTLVYSSAIGSDNVELAKARADGVPCLHRADFLALLMEGFQAITIAGTHGKSTTAAMITHVLDALGVDPTAAIGGAMRRYGSPARAGKSKVFVAEADESDGSFLKYRPHIAVVTNVDLDHMEYFLDRDGLLTAFRSYLSRIDDDGTAVIGWDSPMARQIGADYPRDRLTYGFLIGSEVRGLDYRCEHGETTLTAIVERDQVRVRLKAMGRHNAQNALAALAVARALELDVKKAAESLSTFEGVERRMAHVFEGPGVSIYDDYAHNPGKVAACVQALKSAWPDAQLHVVYQAHRFSRLETMYEAMLGALDGADFVYVVPVYSAGETTARDFSPRRLAEDLARLCAVRAQGCDDLAAAVQSVRAGIAANKAPAVILTVGAGDVWLVAEDLKSALSPGSP